MFFQGHPEYDDISLLKEYKREVSRYYHAETETYPPFPEHYFNQQVQAMLNEYAQQVKEARQSALAFPKFPESTILPTLDNTWRDTARAVFNNWLGKVYQITHVDRRIPFMDGIDPNNPLGL